MKQENTNLPLWKVLNEQRGNKGWRQGQTLPTKQTNKWNKKQWDDNDEVEKRMLFSHFREEDDGRSRIRIAEFENEIDAQYTALAVNNLHILAEALQKAMVIIDRMDEEYRTATGKHSSYTRGEYNALNEALNRIR